MERGQRIGFGFACWPDEDHRGLAVRLDVLLRPRIDQLLANRIGRQRPGGKRPKPLACVPFSSKELLDTFEDRDGVLFYKVNTGQHRAGDLAGCINNGRWKIMFRGARLPRAHLIWKMYHDTDPLGVIDHINMIADDDRIENLRDVTKSQDSRNNRHHDGSTYVHYHWEHRGWGIVFGFVCWPDENHEALAADLHELIAPEFDAIYAGRIGRQKPAMLEAAE
jgi:HNH endonuclease